MISPNILGAISYCKQGANILDASLHFLIGGTLYTSAPTVALTGGGGSGATATAILTNGSITGYTITAPGTGYTSAPSVGLTGGGGVGAVGTAVLSTEAVLKALVLDAGGTGYTNGTHNLVFTGGGGSGATGTATIAGGIVTGVTLVLAGTGYTSAPGVTLASSAGAGNGAFAAHATLGYTVASITDTNGGGQTITFTDNSAYVAPVVLKAINIDIFDNFGGRVSVHMETSPVTASLNGLNTYEGLKAIATIVASDDARKDGTAFDIVTLHSSGDFYMEK